MLAQSPRGVTRVEQRCAVYRNDTQGIRCEQTLKFTQWFQSSSRSLDSGRLFRSAHAHVFFFLLFVVVYLCDLYVCYKINASVDETAGNYVKVNVHTPPFARFAISTKSIVMQCSCGICYSTDLILALHTGRDDIDSVICL